MADSTGKVMAAHGGTLFLDEIGELPVGIQAKLLRFLETGECQTIGSAGGRRCDVRIIAATNRDLTEAIREKVFRLDLYYRLNVIPLTIPPLCQRPGDVPLLLDALTAKAAAAYGLVPPVYAGDARVALESYRWPGNVRELRNFAERMTILHPGATLERSDLPGEFLAEEPRLTHGEGAPPVRDDGFDLEQVEYGLIEEALARTSGNRSKAARMLGLSRHALHYRMKKHAIEFERTAPLTKRFAE